MGIKRMSVVTFMSWPLYVEGKETPAPIGCETGWTPKLAKHFADERRTLI